MRCFVGGAELRLPLVDAGIQAVEPRPPVAGQHAAHDAASEAPDIVRDLLVRFAHDDRIAPKPGVELVHDQEPMSGAAVDRRAQHGFAEIVRAVLDEALELPDHLVEEHLHAHRANDRLRPGQARGARLFLGRDHLVEPAGLEEPLPLVSSHVRRRGAEGAQHFA